MGRKKDEFDTFSERFLSIEVLLPNFFAIQSLAAANSKTNLQIRKLNNYSLRRHLTADNTNKLRPFGI